MSRRPGWREVGLARELSRRAARRARVESLVLLPVVIAVLVFYGYRDELLGREWDKPVRAMTAVALISIGWQLARDVGRGLAPMLFRRLEPGIAGTVDFLIRLLTMLVAATIALRIAGLGPRTLALGGAVTAVVVGLAAQQTLGNLIAGTVLLSARPFKVGDRVRLQGGGLAGEVEGVVSSLGLLYTTLSFEGNPIMIPNAVVLAVAVEPLREPTGVDVRARLRPGVTPTELEQHLKESISTPLRSGPRITLEEIDGQEVIVRIAAVPAQHSDGPRLANEVLMAIAPYAVRVAA